MYCDFVNNEILDYSLILKKCGFEDSSTQSIIKNISNLEEFYSAEELSCIYNYFLNNIEDFEIAIHVIKCADSYRSPILLETLLKILKTNGDIDDDSLINVKVMCAKAISNYKDNSSVSILLDCLNNKKEHYKVRLACADALGRIGDKYAVRPLIDLVEDEEEKSIYLKESATFALGLLGDTSAIDPLINILESRHIFSDKFTFLKEKIVEALGKLNINNKKIVNALKKSLMDRSPIVRINAIEAIMNSDDEESVTLIKPSLKDDNDEVKKNALIALYNIIGREILDEVILDSTYSDFLKNEAMDLINEYEDCNE